MKKKNKIILGIVGFCVFFIVIGALIGSDATPSTDSKLMDACYMSQGFVEDRLRSPSSADFENCYDAVLSYLPDEDIYTVFTYVDSQNGFGAMLRTYYYTELKYIGSEKWKLIDLEIYD